MRALHNDDPDIVTWWGTYIECKSALNRKVREGVLRPIDIARSYVLLYHLQNFWTEVQPIEEIRSLAESLVEKYPLAAADALQLAAALVWSEQETQEHELVSLDKRLWQAARSEGFTVLPKDFV